MLDGNKAIVEKSFHERYATLSDGELLHIAGDRRDLLEEARDALDAEMARRGLTLEQARAQKRRSFRIEMREAGLARRKKSKYLVTQMNLRAFFIGLIGLVLLMVLALRHHRVPDEWALPLFVIYQGALVACLAVQPWVRRTLSFWLCLAVSFVPQFAVAHWLSVYHPAHSGGEEKGSAVLSLIPGYLLGGALFLFLQRLKPKQETNTTS
jgi:hypothetical protein